MLVLLAVRDPVQLIRLVVAMLLVTAPSCNEREPEPVPPPKTTRAQVESTAKQDVTPPAPKKPANFDDWVAPKGLHVAAMATPDVLLRLIETSRGPLLLRVPSFRASSERCAKPALYYLETGGVRELTGLGDGSPWLGALYDPEDCPPSGGKKAEPSSSEPCGLREFTALAADGEEIWMLSRARPAGTAYGGWDQREEVWRQREGRWMRQRTYGQERQIEAHIAPTGGGLLVLVREREVVQQFDMFGDNPARPLPQLTPLDGHEHCKNQVQGGAILKEADSGELLLVGYACAKSGIVVERWDKGETKSHFGLGPRPSAPATTTGVSLATEVISGNHVRILAESDLAGDQVDARFVGGKWTFKQGPVSKDKKDGEGSKKNEKEYFTQGERVRVSETLTVKDGADKDGTAFSTAVRMRGNDVVGFVVLSSKPVEKRVAVAPLTECKPGD